MQNIDFEAPDKDRDQPRLTKVDKAKISRGRNKLDLLMHHPLLTQDFVIPTPPIQQLCRDVRKTVLMRNMGTVFTSPSGGGKSHALRALVGFLGTEFPGLAIVKHNCLNKQMPSIRAFFMHFLNTVNHGDLKGETYTLRDRTVKRIVDCARRSTYNLVVFLIDEAQVMGLDDFCFLKDVSNEAAKHQVHLVTILMAQEPDFDAVLEDLRKGRRLDLISRFASRIRPFNAYSGLDDLNAIFTSIDTETYPADSGWTWTEFFFPKAYKSGFRMVNEAANVFGALKTLGKHLEKEDGAFVFPARQLFTAIRSFMVDNAGFDSADMNIPTDSWRMQLEDSGMPEAMKLANMHYQFSADIQVQK